MEEVFLEKQISSKEVKLNMHYVDKLDSPEHTKGSTYFDFSGLDNKPYAQFKKEFLDLCKDMESYNSKIIVIPLEYFLEKKGGLNCYKTPNNCIYNILKLITEDTDVLKKVCKDFAFIFSRVPEWFIVSVNAYKKSDKPILMSNIETLCGGITRTAAATGVIDNSKITLKDIDREKVKINDDKKTELVEKLADNAEDAATEEELIENLNDPDIVELIEEISDEEYGKPKMTNARASRMTKLNDDFSKSKGTSGKTLKDIIDNPDNTKELPKANIEVASINEESWKDNQFVNFNKIYELDDDVRLILSSFANKDYPISVRGIDVEDTSTSEDYVYTYHVAIEDSFGTQSTLVFDMPKFINNRFMKLRGNEKVISGQLFNIPCSKTSNDTVQVLSNYRKIMISRFGSSGKTYPISDRLIKSINKYNGKDIKVTSGDYSKVCNKYELPVDYIDFAMQYTSVETKHYKFIFDQDYYRLHYEVDLNKGIPIAIDKGNDSIVYGMTTLEMNTISEIIANLMLSDSDGLLEIYNAQKASTKHVYSRASIMAAEIPLVVVICNSIPFTEFLKRASIQYTFSDKRVRYDPDKTGCIKFNDGFLLFDITYASSMMMNGLFDCDTESFKFLDMNKKSTWLSFLDNFGGRIKSDGLDNFKEVFMDPITQEVCRELKLPEDYIDILIYANNLLADNKYSKHTDISTCRYRTGEIIAGHFYQVLAGEYIRYRSLAKHGKRNIKFSLKKSAVIDSIMENPVMSDLSSMTPLLELEANNSATFKGLSGLNNDRSYSLDKRTYDESMSGKLAMSTGFAANVGINRQTTMNMDIQGKRGYIKNTPVDNKDVGKRFSATEAVTPFGSTRDDPFRTAMTYIQTSKHAMPTNKSMPLLVTNGADAAMAHMVSETYIIKAEEDGEVVEYVPDDHFIIKYTKGSKEGKYISLKEETYKNSDGGFYCTIKFNSDLTKNKQKFKAGDIIAYDELAFSNKNGEKDELAYDVGVLAYVAIMATDEGYEDSTAISEWLSEALGSKVVAESDVELGKNANILDIVKPGDQIKEGDPMIIFQNSFEEEDANILLKNITDEDFVSDLGRIRIKSKYTGIVQDVKIYRTCEIDEMSESLQKLIKEYNKNIKKKKDIYKKYNIPGSNTLDADYSMPPTGKLKNTDGVRIEFYIKYFDNLGIGDKLVMQSANKGVVKYMFPIGDEPYSQFDPSKKIHAVCSARSFNARMVTSPIVSGAINKGLINLNEQVKKIMGVPITKIEDMQ